MSTIDEISTEAFEKEVMESTIPVLVDFHAEWCGPCKAAYPALLDLANEFDGEVRIVQVDIEAEPAIAKAYDVRGVPTFLMVKDGEVKERFSGALTRGKLSALFERYLAAE
ncbi:MAG: thioredoxin family protein [Sphingopyxis sp.]|nr:thioredoxin family protein [Sphingopyxis sp.]